MSIRWGLSATILAPARQILEFAAYHLEAGAHRLYLYLDDEIPGAFAPLKAHPKIRVFQCDDAHWARLGMKRPRKHQVRQAANATHAYHRRPEVDWLIHMDVDEFLVSKRPVAAVLADLPPDQSMTRLRPMEALAGDGSAFKAWIPPGPDRDRITRQIYPTYGGAIKAGFLSHLAGKVFLRTGLEGISVKIHNAFEHGEMLESDAPTSEIDLAHLHANSWDEWIAAYRYRHAHGAYRAELAPNRPRDKGGQSLHEVLAQIEAAEGETGLRRFFDEVCADTPALRARLAEHGFLKRANLDLKATLFTHFPEVPG